MSDQLASWLRCPICGRDLRLDSADALTCDSGHRFDINKRGYAGLLTGRAATARSVSAAQLDALDVVFASDLFDPVIGALEAMLPRAGELRVADAGSGVGHLLRPAMATRPDARALAIGDSPSVVARSMRISSADGLLCDAEREWPVRDGAATVALTLLAEHRPAELHRILAPGGVLVAAVVGYDHLAELRPTGEYPEWHDAVAELVDDVFPWFEHDQSRTVTETRVVDAATARALVSARDLIGGTATASAAEPAPGGATVDVTVVRFRRRRRRL